ncbi:MAG: gamma-glutamyltransferase [Candidatus Krumholzibacteriia bacterium]
MPAWSSPGLAVGGSVMVASAHPAATAAGVAVLRDGGTAVDAAVATAFALAVVEPYSSGLGGGGFAVGFTPGRAAGDAGETWALDFREIAPAAAHRELYFREGRPVAELSRTGGLAVAVPGMVRGLEELHRQGGRLPWRRLLEPAVALARDGFPVSALLRERIARHAPRLNDAARAIFLDRGEVPAEGSLLRQPDLARTLAAVAAGGADAFHTGRLAEAVAAGARGAGGILTAQDLAAFRSRWRVPVEGRYRGLRVVGMPPPSSGGVHVVEMLQILDGWNLAAAEHGSAEASHLLLEVMKQAFAERSMLLGDPDFVAVPVDRLLSRGHADSLRALVDRRRARPPESIPGAPVVAPESAETSHLSVVDAAGGAVAVTVTINLVFGSGVVAPGTGVVLNDEMDDFATAPGLPNAFGLVGGEANAVAAGKRPLSSMAPTLLLREGAVYLVTGSPGGSRIISTVLQTIVNVVDFGMDPYQAVAAPRLHHQWWPRTAYHEPYGISPDTRRLLEGYGHRWSEREPMGNAQLIVVDPETGQRRGASDPRGMGLAAGF